MGKQRCSLQAFFSHHLFEISFVDFVNVAPPEIVSRKVNFCAKFQKLSADKGIIVVLGLGTKIFLSSNQILSNRIAFGALNVRPAEEAATNSLIKNFADHVFVRKIVILLFVGNFVSLARLII